MKYTITIERLKETFAATIEGENMQKLIQAKCPDMEDDVRRRAVIRLFFSGVALALQKDAFPKDTPIYETENVDGRIRTEFKGYPPS